MVIGSFPPSGFASLAAGASDMVIVDVFVVRFELVCFIVRNLL